MDLKNECVDPRFKYVARDCAEYVEWLGQKENPAGKGWAAGAGYGAKIITILNASTVSKTGKNIVLFDKTTAHPVGAIEDYRIL